MLLSAKNRSVRAHQSISITLLFLAGIVNFLDRSSLSVANTTIRAEMHLSGTQMGWLLTAFSLSYGISQLGLVGILDRAGTRTMLTGALGVWSIAQALTSLVRGFVPFLALRVLLGAGESPFFPAGVRVIREWFSEKGRGKATAVLNGSSTLGLAISPPILTWLMLRMGWRPMFLLLGAAGMGMAALWGTLHRVRTEMQSRGEHMHAPWGLLLRQRSMIGMMIGFGGINCTNWLYISWLPGYLEQERHMTLATSGWFAALPFLAASVGCVANGLFVDRMARRGASLVRVHRMCLVICMCLSAVSTFVVARVPTAGEAVAGIACALFFIHFAGTSGWGLVQAITDHDLVASVGALQNFGSFMIASIVPVMTGFLLDTLHSFVLALTLCAGATVACAMAYWWIVKPRIVLTTAS